MIQVVVEGIPGIASIATCKNGLTMKLIQTWISCSLEEPATTNSMAQTLSQLMKDRSGNLSEST